MSFPTFEQLARAEDARMLARQLQCKHPGYFCDAALSDTVRCHGCGKNFCEKHMVDVLCVGCDRVDAKADQLNDFAAVAPMVERPNSSREVAMGDIPSVRFLARRSSNTGAAA